MRTATRITLSVATGILLGLTTLVVEDPGFPTAGVNAAIDLPLTILATIVFLVVPLVVGRWWVVFAMVGPGLALLILQAADVAVRLDDGTGPAINYRTIIQFILLAGVMLAVGGVRSLLAALQLDQPG